MRPRGVSQDRRTAIRSFCSSDRQLHGVRVVRSWPTTKRRSRCFGGRHWRRSRLDQRLATRSTSAAPCEAALPSREDRCLGVPPSMRTLPRGSDGPRLLQVGQRGRNRYRLGGRSQRSREAEGRGVFANGANRSSSVHRGFDREACERKGIGGLGAVVLCDLHGFRIKWRPPSGRGSKRGALPCRVSARCDSRQAGNRWATSRYGAIRGASAAVRP
jgi:hypothetical protein